MIRTRKRKADNDARILAESIIETINESLLILDEKLCIVSVNRTFLQVFHVSYKETTGKLIYELGDGQWNIDALRELLEKIIPENGQFNNFEVRHAFPRIGTKIMLLNGRRINQSGGRRKLILLAIEDITKQKAAEEHIRYLSFHDTVTGLYNRSYFEEELRRIDTERKLPISIITGDINNLKIANDTFGHSEGDKLLKKMADILRDSCRSNDMVARWGGDEFIIILPKTGNDTAESIVRVIQQKCSKAAGTAIQPSIALGSATKNTMEENISLILKEAEERMYKDKTMRSRMQNQDEAGRGRLADVIADSNDAVTVAGPNRDITSIREFPQRIILAQEEERSRIAYEIHDDFGQSLISLKMFVSMAASELPDTDASMKQKYEQIKDKLSDIIEKVRDLSHKLAPPSLKYIGLVATTKKLIKSISFDNKIKFTFIHRNMDKGAFETTDMIVYRIIQEVLTNSIKHAQATKVNIAMMYGNGEISLKIKDNGIGFDKIQLQRGNGLGFELMKERAKLIGAKLHVISRPGAGTTVQMTVPVRENIGQ